MSNNCCVQCPYCGNDVDVIQGMELLAGNEWTALIQGLPNALIGVLLRYLELFKPLKQELRWSRRLSLTQELMPMIKAAQVKRHGIVYAAPMAVWEAEMLKLVAQRPETVVLPLKSNGYLISMIAGKAEAKAAQQEAQTEQQRRNKGASGTAKGLIPVNQQVSASYEQTSLTLEELTAMEKQKALEREQHPTPPKPPDGWKGVIK